MAENLGAAPATMVDNYGGTLPAGCTPAGCCGATWRPKALKRIGAERGITIIAESVQLAALLLNAAPALRLLA